MRSVFLLGLGLVASLSFLSECKKTSTSSAKPDSWTTLLTSKGTATGTAIAIDTSGNSIVTGHFRGTLETLDAGEDTDIFVTQLSKTGGKVEWIRKLGSTAVDQPHTLALDSQNNIFIAGQTAGGLDDLSTPSQEDFFVAKLDKDGKSQWIEQWGPTPTTPPCAQVSSCSLQASIQDLVLDSDGTLYVTGFVWGNLEGNINNGGYDVVISKLSASGVVGWTTLLGSSEDDFGYDITLDAAHNLYVVGQTNGNFENETNHGQADAFVAKLDAQGKLQWATLIGGTGQDSGTDISVHSEKNNLILLGSTDGSISTNTALGQGDLFLAQLDFGGKILSTEILGTPQEDHPGDVMIIGEKQIFVTGTSRGNMKQGKNSAATQTEAAFVQKLTALDQDTWTQARSTTTTDTVYGFQRASSGAWVVVGTTQSTFEAEKITRPTRVWVWQLLDLDL